MNQTVSYYDEHAKEYCMTTLEADMSFCRDKFAEHLLTGAHVLDAGCGSGRDSLAFMNQGFSVTAMDASPKMCEMASQLLGQDVLCLTFSEINFQNEFDGVWACASLLHVPKDEMNATLQKIRDSLKPDGVFYASFKYGTEERTERGRLFSDYDEESLTTLLQENGFTICDIFITEDVRQARCGEKWVNGIAKKLASF